MDVIFSRSLTRVHLMVSYCEEDRDDPRIAERWKAADVIGTLSHPLAAEHPA